MLEHLTRQGVTDRLELVLVDCDVTAAAARALGRDHDLEAGRVGWDDKQPVFRTIRHAWPVEVACIATTLRHLSRERARRRPVALAA
jgi:putative transposase